MVNPDPFGSGPLALRRNPARGAQDDRVDLSALLRSLWAGRYMLLAFAMSGVLLAAFAVARVTPQYAALSRVLLDPRESRYITETEVVSDLVLTDQVIDSEVSILKSNVLLGEVIRTLGLAELAPIDPKFSSPSVTDRIKSLLGLDPPALAVVDPNEADIERLVWALRKRTDIWRSGKSYIISIKAETPIPALSQKIAQTIADTYIAQQLAGRQATAQQATLWIEQRVADLRGQVEAAEDAVQAYRATKVDGDTSSVEIATQQMLELNNQLVIARVDRVAAESRRNEIARLVDSEGAAAVTDIIGTDTLDRLKEERQLLLRRDSVWAERYDETHPERRRIRGELARLAGDFDVEIRKQLDALGKEVEIARLREETLQASLTDIERRVIEASRAEIGLRQLEREAHASRSAYEDLLNRLSETRTQEKFQTADARLVEHATRPLSPSSPRPKLMMALGGAVGSMIGLVVLLMTTLGSGTFRSLPDVEAATGLPVVAAIPEGKWPSPRKALAEIADDPYGLLAERVRHMRAALTLGEDAQGAQSLTLLSAVPGEGKTTLGLLLADVAARAGKAVIVVDCDLRRESLRDGFGWKLNNDLVDLLQGRCHLDEAIYDETGLGFDVLVPAEAAPDIADQMSLRWLRSVVDELKLYYDLVIVNAPALLAVSDALMIAKSVDTRLFVVRQGATPRAAVMRALAALDDRGLRTAGIVLSRGDPREAAAGYGPDYSYQPTGRTRHA